MLGVGNTFNKPLQLLSPKSLYVKPFHTKDITRVSLPSQSLG